MQAIRERTKSTSRTAQIPILIQKHDKFHTLPVERQQTLGVIYQALYQRSGVVAAEKWLETQLKAQSPTSLPLLTRASHLETPNPHPTHPQNPLPEPPRSPISPLKPQKGVLVPPKTLKPVLTPLSVQSQEFSQIDLDKLCAPLESQLSPTGFRLYRILLESGFEVSKARGYSPNVGVVTYFCPQEIVAHALGVDRTTIWRNLPKLIALGLLDASEWKTDLYGDTRNAGYLWQIKLNPDSPHKPRLTQEDFKHPWRNLRADVESQHTAYRLTQSSSPVGETEQQNENGVESIQVQSMQQSLSKKDTKQVINQILSWALPPLPNQSPLCMTVAGQNPAKLSLETLLDVPYAEKHERNQIVDNAAQAIAFTLNDSHSTNFYRNTLWNLLRQFDRGNNWFMPFYQLILRTRTDLKEGFARKGGALLQARLKQCGFWDELRRTPAFRVGERPMV